MAKKSPEKRQIEFKFSAPDAKWVGVAGDFNGWKPDVLVAKKDKSGTWKATAQVPSGVHEYKFVVDGQWLPDPSCPRKKPNAFGTENSVVEVK